MERITISLKSDLARQFDDFIQARGYSNRSEAMRDLIRDRLETDRLSQGEVHQCVGVLSYVYSHSEYELPTRLARILHENYGLTISNTHIQISEEDCLDTLVLRGSSEQIRALSDRITSERGVRHGRLQLIVQEETSALAGMNATDLLFGASAVASSMSNSMSAGLGNGVGASGHVMARSAAMSQA